MTDHNMVEPIDRQAQKDNELRRLADDIAKRLRLGEVIPEVGREDLEVSMHNTVIVCIDLGLESELNKFFNQELTRSELCDEIAHELAPLVYESRKPEVADFFIDEYQAIEKALKG